MSDTTNDEQAKGWTVKIHGKGGNSPELVNDGIREDEPKAATAPLLSDDELTAITKRYPEVNGDTSTAYETGDEIRAWYEAKIASGELMVVKTAELWHPHVPEDEWRKWLHGSDPEFTMLVTKCCNRNPWTPPWLLSKAFIDKEGVFNRTSAGYVCPGCGAKIIEG